MTCSYAKQLIAASWSGEQSEREALDLHLGGCPECAAEMETLSGLWNRLADMPAPEPSPALDARWQSTFDAMLSAQRAANPQMPAREPWFRALWPKRMIWQMGFAAACLVAGVVVGNRLPHQGSEIEKLHQEIASTREMVALSLLQQQSATERLRGVNYTGTLPTIEPQVLSALTDAVAHDPSVNVRLAAIDALTRASGSQPVLRSLTQSLPRQDSPMVQAAVIDYLIDAHDRNAVQTLRQLAKQPDLNPVVVDRAHYALQQLTK